MPLYPADGSVAVLDGRVVVKIQEEYTPKSEFEIAYETGDESMHTKETPRSGLLSVVLPAYNEEASVPLAARTIHTILAQADIPHEPDLCQRRLQRRHLAGRPGPGRPDPPGAGHPLFPQLRQGVGHLRGPGPGAGDCCVVMDWRLAAPAGKGGGDVPPVAAGLPGGGGREGERGKESPLHTLAARTFYHFISQATQIDMSRASDFKLLDRRAVDVLIAMREKNAFFRALSSWIA